MLNQIAKRYPKPRCLQTPTAIVIDGEAAERSLGEGRSDSFIDIEGVKKPSMILK
jgi:hypothetical protein